MRTPTSTKEKAANPNKLPVGKFFLWKSRDVSLAAVTVIVSGYLMIFCSDTLGMDTALVGTLLMVSKLFDGVTDLFAGYIVDNTHTKLGKARPYEICIVLAWLCTVALFFADESWAMPVKCAWVFIMYTFVYSIFTTMLSGNQTPYMVRAFSGNRAVIVKVSSFGGIVSMGCSMVVSVLFPRMMAKLVTAPGAAAGGWRTLILIFAVPLALIGILRFIFVKEDPAVDAGQTAQKISLKEIITMLKTNKYAWSFAGVIGLYNLVYSLGAGTYYFQYIVGDISAFGLVSVFGIVLLPVMLAFPLMMKKLNIANLFEIFAFLSAGGYLLVFLGGSNLAMVYAGVVISTLISLPASYLQAPCIMDLATYNEYNGYHRMEGTTSIVSGFLSKVMGGVGTGLTGILLSLAGFVSTTSGEVVTQPGSALLMIRICYSLLPMACMVLMIVCALHFGKLCKRMPEIDAEVKARKAAVLAAEEQKTQKAQPQE